MVRLPLTPEQLANGKALGEALRRARGDATLAVSAAAAGISPETLRKIETGRLPSPSFFTIASLCAHYGVSLDEIASLVHRSGLRAVL